MKSQMMNKAYIQNFDEIIAARKEIEVIDRQIDKWLDIYISNEVKKISDTGLDEKLETILDKVELDLSKLSYEIGKNNEGILVAPIVGGKDDSLKDFANEAGFSSYSADTHDIEALYHRGEDINYNEIRITDNVEKNSITYSVSEKVSKKLNQMLIDKLVDKNAVVNENALQKINEVASKYIDSIIPLSQDLTLALNEQNTAKYTLATLMAEQKNRLEKLNTLEITTRISKNRDENKFLTAAETVTDKIASAIERVGNKIKPLTNMMKDLLDSFKKENESISEAFSNTVNSLGASANSRYIERINNMKSAVAYENTIGDKGFENIVHSAKAGVYFKHLEELSKSYPFEAELKKADNERNGKIGEMLSSVKQALNKARYLTTEEGKATIAVKALTFLAEKSYNSGKLANTVNLISRRMVQISLECGTCSNPMLHDFVQNSIDKAESIAKLKEKVSYAKESYTDAKHKSVFYGEKREKETVIVRRLETEISNLRDEKENLPSELQQLKLQRDEALRSGVDTSLSNVANDNLDLAIELNAVIKEKETRFIVIDDEISKVAVKLDTHREKKAGYEEKESMYADIAKSMEKAANVNVSAQIDEILDEVDDGLESLKESFSFDDR